MQLHVLLHDAFDRSLSCIKHGFLTICLRFTLCCQRNTHQPYAVPTLHMRDANHGHAFLGQCHQQTQAEQVINIGRECPRLLMARGARVDAVLEVEQPSSGSIKGQAARSRPIARANGS